MPGAAAQFLDLPAGADAKAALAGAVGRGHRLAVIDDDAAGRQVRPRHKLHQLIDAGIGKLDQVQCGIAQLRGVVRRDGCRHADGDTRCAVGEQVREGAGQNHRFLVLAVVGFAEVDRVLVDALQQQDGDFGQAGFGIAVGRGVVAVDVAEIALAFDQWVALGKVLRQADHGVIDGLIAVRVVFADHVADNAGTFLETGVGVELEHPHGIEQPAVDRLQAIANIGQRAMHDGRQRVGQVALFQRLAQIDRFYVRITGWGYQVTHDSRIIASP